MHGKLKKLYELLDKVIIEKDYEGVNMRFDTYRGFKHELKRSIICHVITKHGGVPYFIYSVNDGMLTTFCKDFYDMCTDEYGTFHNVQLRLRELSDYIINEIGYDNFIFKYKKRGRHRELIVT